MAFHLGGISNAKIGIIQPTYNAGELDGSVLEEINHLVFVARDVQRRMIGTQFEHVSSLCRTLIDLVTGILESFPKASDKDMELLKQLSDAVLVGFHPNNESAVMAAEISDSIKSFEAKRADCPSSCSVPLRRAS